jgi:hypothetical protein
MIPLSKLTQLRSRIEAVRAYNMQFLSGRGRPLDPGPFIESVTGFKLDEWQSLYTTAARVEALVAIAASRQSGKSTVAAGFVAWCLIFIPGFRCLVASRSLRQASYFVLKVRQAVLSIVPPDAMVLLNRLSLELPNGSFIISIPCAQPDAGRGFDPHLVVIDEAAYAPEELFNAIYPSVAATRGAVHMISSPNGRFGRFFNAFEGDARDDYWTARVTYKDCPRISDEQMAIEQRNMGMLMWRQEFMAEFIVPEGAFFGASAVMQFEEGEEFDLSDLELADMEAIVDKAMPLPVATVDDLRMAFDRADRVKKVLYG